METPESSLVGVQQRGDWLSRLSALVDEVERWGRETDWATRRIETDNRWYVPGAGIAAAKGDVSHFA